MQIDRKAIFSSTIHESTDKSLESHAETQRRQGFTLHLFYFALLAALRATFLQ
jgi:hypothetical protein